MSSSQVIGSAAIFAALAVILGAFAAHGLKHKLDAYSLAVWQTGVTYHFFHAFALLAVGILMKQTAQGTISHWVIWAFIAGILLFSGSLYLLAITGVKKLGAITPIGGMAFIVGWLLLAWNMFRET
ncbi:MAG: DUF423 domain-containing protein [Pseudomonadota bacterium]